MRNLKFYCLFIGFFRVEKLSLFVLKIPAEKVSGLRRALRRRRPIRWGSSQFLGTLLRARTAFWRCEERRWRSWDDSAGSSHRPWRLRWRRSAVWTSSCWTWSARAPDWWLPRARGRRRPPRQWSFLDRMLIPRFKNGRKTAWKKFKNWPKKFGKILYIVLYFLVNFNISCDLSEQSDFK